MPSPPSDSQPPWKRKNPRKKSRTLTPAQKQQARSRARAAGRKYPNLVDNMAVAKEANAKTRKRTTTKKSKTKRTAAKKSKTTRAAAKKSKTKRAAPKRRART